MDKNTKFSYTYSAAANREVQEIRNRYMPREESKFEQLKRLDHKVQTSGISQSLAVGIIGFLLFGLGVCMTVQIVGESVILGILLGLAGAIVMLFAYPVYRLIFRKTKEQLVPRILQLTCDLSGGNSDQL